MALDRKWHIVFQLKTDDSPYSVAATAAPSATSGDVAFWKFGGPGKQNRIFVFSPEFSVRPHCGHRAVRSVSISVCRINDTQGLNSLCQHVRSEKKKKSEVNHRVAFKAFEHSRKVLEQTTAKLCRICLISRIFSPQNVINAKTSSSVQLPAEGRRSSPDQRLSQRPATLPWAQGGNVHRDGPGAFILDLHNFPDLSKADINGQNPNIQVTVCVCAPAPRRALMLLTAASAMADQAGRTGSANRKKGGATVWCTSLPPFFPAPLPPSVCPRPPFSHFLEIDTEVPRPSR